MFDVGSVFARLRLDKKEWDQSIQSVAQDKRRLGDMAFEVGAKMGDLGKKMAAAGGIITGALGGVILKTANAGDAINDLSKRTGIATDTLSGYKLAADKSGTSLDGLAVGMRGLANQMEAASRGGKEQKAVFDGLGIAYADNEGRLRPLNDVMLDVADRFAGMADGATKTALAQDIFGRSGMELIPMLNLGSAGLRAEREEAERLGMVFSGTAAQACDDFNDSIASLKGATNGLTKEIGTALLPMAQSLIGSITNVISGIRGWAAEHPGLTSALSTTGLALGGMATAAGSFILIIGTLITKLAALAATLGTTMGALSVSIAVWSAATLAVGFYVAKLFELSAAEDYAIAANNRLHETEDKLVDKLSEAAVAADWQFGRMSRLIEAYDGNVRALAMAIQKGKEGKDIQEALAKVGKQHSDVIDDQRKKMENQARILANALIPKLKETRELISTPLPAGRDLPRAIWEFSAQITETAIPAARDLAGVVNEVMPSITRVAQATCTETNNAFSGLWNNIAQGFGNTVTEWIRGATTFKEFMDGLWQDILQGFTQWIGQKLTSKMVDFFDGLFSKAKKTGEGVVGTVQSLTSGATQLSTAATGAISGVWTAAGAAIGSFLGTTLAGIFGGGPSGHQQQQGINDTKDSRNFLADIKNWFFSAGSGFGGAVWDYLAKFEMEKFDETKGFIARLGDEQIGPRIDRMNSDVCGWLDTISGKLSGLKSAAGGAVSTRTELVAVHGTPSNPEYIIPADKLAAMSGPRGGGGSPTINIILNGTMVSTSEFSKNSVFPAIIEAVKSGYRKAEFQAALGVA